MKQFLLILVCVAVALTGQTRIGNSTGGSSSGGGATNLASITDFLPYWKTATTMGINSAALTTGRVNGGVGLTSYGFTSPGEVTVSGSGTGGTVFWSQYQDGAIYATPSTAIVGITLTSTGGTAVTIDSPGTTFKGKAIATTSISNAGQWSTTIVDYRAFFSQDRIITGSGCVSTSETPTSIDISGVGCGATVPGSNTQVIFNDSGALGADAGMTYVKATDALTILGTVTVGANGAFIAGQFGSVGRAIWNNESGDSLVIEGTTNRYAGNAVLYFGQGANPSFAVPRDGGIQILGGLLNTRAACSTTDSPPTKPTIGSLFYTTGSPANLDLCALDYAGNPNWQTLGASGVYTPTLTAVANVAASTANPCQWHRDGLAVTVSCKLDVDPTAAATLTQVGISLPIASALTNDYQVAGSGASPAIATQSGGVLADATNDRAELDFTSVSLANSTWYISFTYRVI